MPARAMAGRRQLHFYAGFWQWLRYDVWHTGSAHRHTNFFSKNQHTHTNTCRQSTRTGIAPMPATTSSMSLRTSGSPPVSLIFDTPSLTNSRASLRICASHTNVSLRKDACMSCPLKILLVHVHEERDVSYTQIYTHAEGRRSPHPSWVDGRQATATHPLQACSIDTVDCTVP